MIKLDVKTDPNGENWAVGMDMMGNVQLRLRTSGKDEQEVLITISATIAEAMAEKLAQKAAQSKSIPTRNTPNAKKPAI